MTPLMRQYFTIKEQHESALVLFQVGDFYELFFQDAIKAATFLGITLTARGTHENKPIPLCGVPVHNVDHYVSKLVRAGFTVVLVNQLEEARPGIVVPRGVATIFTPGTLTELTMLDARSPSYLVTIFAHTNNWWGIAGGQLLGSELWLTQVSSELPNIDAELARYNPDEIVVLEGDHQLRDYCARRGYYVTCWPYTHMETKLFQEWVGGRTETGDFQYITEQVSMSGACDLWVQYVNSRTANAAQAIERIAVYRPTEYVQIDAQTQRHLEIIKNSHDGSARNTVSDFLSSHATAMGARMVRHWLTRPLADIDKISARADSVEYFVQDFSRAQMWENYLNGCGDIERLIGRILLQKAQPREFCSLLQGLQSAQKIVFIEQDFLQKFYQYLAQLQPLIHLMSRALESEFTEGGRIIRAGFSSELDLLWENATNTAQLIIALEGRAQQETGINSLKIRHNSVYGYVIEITRTNLEKIPKYYERVHSLTGRERYTTPELRAIERDTMQAQKAYRELEQDVYTKLCDTVRAQRVSLRGFAQELAILDALIAVARVSMEQGYVRPRIVSRGELYIDEGKHPIVAARLGNCFVPNTIRLTETDRLWIVTGPNMGGKSTFLRQTALITLMAHCGFFIPARCAQILLCDRIAARVGAADNVAQGTSTFMMEMEETAYICAHATDKSLVILDEIGRGTSTHDGIAIAQAVIEFLVQVVKVRGICATHYHELTGLAQTVPGVSSWHAATTRTPQGIVLLHRIVPGGAEGSFGIDVAQRAGVPAGVVHRAAQLAEAYGAAHVAREPQVECGRCVRYNTLLGNIDFDTMSPKQAFDILWVLLNK